LLKKEVGYSLTEDDVSVALCKVSFDYSNDMHVFITHGSIFLNKKYVTV